MLLWCGYYGLSIVEINYFFDRAVGKQLAVCPHIKRVLFSRGSSPFVHYTWNMCCLDSQHCDFHGCRLKFKSYFGGVRVAWVCPKLVGLPDFGDGDFGRTL
jgi:hypothetical protein